MHSHQEQSNPETRIVATQSRWRRLQKQLKCVQRTAERFDASLQPAQPPELLKLLFKHQLKMLTKVCTP